MLSRNISNLPDPTDRSQSVESQSEVRVGGLESREFEVRSGSSWLAERISIVSSRYIATTSDDRIRNTKMTTS
jgi:hypothetical protein